MLLRLLFALLTVSAAYAQKIALQYELDLTIENDAFNVTVSNLQLNKKDSIFSFVSYAPGVHQPLDFGRFVKLFKVYDKNGVELITNKISTNDFLLLEPLRVAKIEYIIDDSFDMSIKDHPIYPMSGTGITDSYTIINSHGVFGYFPLRKDNAIELQIKVNGDPLIGTALNKNNDGFYVANSYYHLADSPVLVGDNLTYDAIMVEGIKVEAFVFSPNSMFDAAYVLKEAVPILEAATNFIGYAPVDRYTFLMYFNDAAAVEKMPVLKFGGALEHSYSSTYALPADEAVIAEYLKNTMAHEFMHILAPLHLRSEILANIDYSRPVSEDDHVWLYEGVTEWVSYKMQLLNGTITFDDYLNYLSTKITNSNIYNEEYSLMRISQEWHTEEGNKQYSNIYQLGALTAAMLDIKLLQLSEGEIGLREVYLELIEAYGENRPFDNDKLFEEIIAMTYPEIDDFVNDHIINNTPFNFEAYAGIVGLQYFSKKINKENIPTMGLDFRDNEEGKIVIASFRDEYKGSNLKVGDEIIAIDGIQLTDYDSYMLIMDSIKKRKVGDTFEVEVSRNGEQLKVVEHLAAKYDYNVFEVDENASETAKFLRGKLIKGAL